MSIFENTKFPDTEICLAARDLVKSVSDPYLFNHVCRTFAFGTLVGNRAAADFDEEAFFIACMLHDLGLTEKFASTEERFELAGADAAKDFLSRKGWSDRRIDVVWDAIALHASPGIPQKKRPEIALVQTGAGIDLGVLPLDAIDPGVLEQVLESWPRLDFKTAIIEAFTDLAKRNPSTAIFSFVADFGVRGVEGFALPNACDIIHGAAFSE